ncbi:hypothetical protein D3C85_1611790 [compost metagenome]
MFFDTDHQFAAQLFFQRVGIQRFDGKHIQHAAADPALGQQVCYLQRCRNHAAGRDQRNVRPLPKQVRFAGCELNGVTIDNRRAHTAREAQINGTVMLRRCESQQRGRGRISRRKNG